VRGRGVQSGCIIVWPFVGLHIGINIKWRCGKTGYRISDLRENVVEIKAEK
jgi:hypothetical protein